IIGQRDVGKSASIGIFIVRVIISQRAFAPAAQVIIEIRSGPDAAALAVIDVDNAIELFVQEPGVAAEEEWAEAAAVARNKIKVVGAWSQVAGVKWKIEYRHGAQIKRGAMRDDLLPGNDLEVMGADFYGRLGNIIGGD